ncbi:MAG: TonB-dependent receptor [Oceanococcus sp.]
MMKQRQRNGTRSSRFALPLMVAVLAAMPLQAQSEPNEEFTLDELFDSDDQSSESSSATDTSSSNQMNDEPTSRNIVLQEETPPDVAPPRPKHRVLEEIIVTAQKKEESLRDVPISVMALSEDFLKETGVTDLNDVTFFTPNVKVNATPSIGFISMRGIGSGNNKGVEQSVGLVVDGIYYSRLAYVTDGMLDLSRIEVLRGPQGTLFGKNTVAGAFNMTTGSPSEELTGSVDILQGELGHSRQRIAVGGPLVDDLVNYRVAFSRELRDGQVRNSAFDIDPDSAAYRQHIRNPSPYLRDRDNFVGRLKLNFPSLMDDLDLTVGVTQSQVDQNSLGLEMFLASARTQRAYSSVDPQFETNPDNVASIGNEEYAARETTSYTLHADYDIGEYLVSFVGGHSNYEQEDLLDADFGPVRFLGLWNDDKFSQQTLELRLASPPGDLEFVAGAYYFGSDLDGHSQIRIDATGLALVASAEAPVYPIDPINGLFDAVQGLLPVDAGIPPPLNQDEFNDRVFAQTTDSKALFGQVTWRPWDRWSFIGGLRYTTEEKVMDLVLSHSNPLGSAIFQYAQGEDDSFTIEGLSRKESDLSPKISAVFDWTDDINFYGTYATAFKGGGFNEQAPNTEKKSVEYEPEHATTWEFGSKMRLLDGAMTLNIGLFSTEFKDLQVSLFDGTTFVVNNATDAFARGVEAEWNWLPNDWLSVGASAAYLHARYREYQGAQCAATVDDPEDDGCDLSGASLVRAPDYSGAIHTRATLPLWPSRGLGMQLGWDMSFTGDVFLTTDNDPVDTQPAYAQHNVQISIGDIDKNWSLTLFGWNILDEKYLNGSQDVPLQPGSHSGVYSFARRLHLEMRYNW